MQVALKDGYVLSWSLNANIENSITVDNPDDFADFMVYYSCYLIQDNKLVKDLEMVKKYSLNEYIKKLRIQREQECFAIVNRGELWYSTLSKEQHDELNEWYHDWLNVTDTYIIPEKPKWI